MDRKDKNFDMYRDYWGAVYDNSPIIDDFVPWLDETDGIIYGSTEPSIIISREQYLEMLCTLNHLVYEISKFEHPPITIAYELQPSYCEHPSVSDETFDDMVDIIENYIDFCAEMAVEYPEFGYSGEAHIGFAQKTKKRCEMVCFNPDLDDIYCTPATMKRLLAFYPEIESGMPMVRKRKMRDDIP